MKILVIGGTGHVGRLVVNDLRARGVDVRVLARQRPRPGTLPGKVKVAIGDVIRSEIYPELIDLNVRFLMRVAPRPCWFCALALFLFPGNVHSNALLLLFQFKNFSTRETGNAIR